MTDLPPDTPDVELVYGWSGPVLPIGRFAGDLDRRRFNNVSWPSLPLVLADNHSGVEFLGPIDSMEILSLDEIASRVELSDQDREEIGTEALWASGRIIPNEEGTDLAGQLAFWGRIPVSVEVRDGEYVESEIRNADDEIVGYEMDWTRTVVGAVARERLPAFAGAWIRPDREAAAFTPEEEPVDDIREEIAALREEVDRFRTAGAGPHAFAAPMFEPYKVDGPSRFTISAQGEVTGTPIIFGKTHRANSSWTAAFNPRDDLSEWLVGATTLDDGRTIRTGVIVSDGLHAPAHQAGSSADNIRHLIESTATQLAVVNAWQDQHGIHVHGSTLPGVTPEQVTRAMAGCLSVDQRDLNDGRGFVTMGVLAVNTCGFSPASAVVSIEDGEPVRRLVASAAPPAEGCGCGQPESACGCGTPNPFVAIQQPAQLHSFGPDDYAQLSDNVAWYSTDTSGIPSVRAASADDPEPAPDPSPVVDLAALRRQDEAWEKARLAAAVAPTPKK